MTDRQADTTEKVELYSIPPWARDPRVLAAELYDGRDMPFGVVVPPLLQEHEFDIAPLGLGLSNIIKRALQKHKKKRLVLSR